MTRKVALARGDAFLGAKVPGPPDPTTNFYSGKVNQLELLD